MKFAAYMVVSFSNSFIFFYSIFYHRMYGCMFCMLLLILAIMYFYCYVYVLLLSCFSIPIVMYCSGYSVSLCCSMYCLGVNVCCTTATG